LLFSEKRVSECGAQATDAADNTATLSFLVILFQTTKATKVWVPLVCVAIAVCNVSALWIR